MIDMETPDFNDDKYRKNFSEEAFMKKVLKFAAKAGAKVIYPSFQLFYTMSAETTPYWARLMAIGALGYFISPLDVIPDVIPVIGYSDDLAVLLSAIMTLTPYITEEIKEKAKKSTRFWLGENSI